MKEPRLKFKNNISEWKNFKISDFLSYKNIKQVETVEAPLMSFVANKGIVEKGERYDRSFLVKSKEKKYKRTDLNDFIYSSNNLDVGSIGLNKYGSAVISDVYEIFTINHKKSNINFFNAYLTSKPIINKFLKYRQGCLYGQYKINANDFLNVNIKVPTLETQNKIGHFLDYVDKKIVSLEEKMQSLELLKNELLRQIFSREIRFKDENGEEFPEWKLSKIKDHCSVNTGKSNTQDQSKNGKYPFFIRSEEIVKSDKYLYDCEAVLTIGDGKIGKVFHYINGKFDLHQRVYIMNRFSNELDGKFFYYYFSYNFLRRAMRMSAKATVDSVRKEMITDMDLQLPIIEEQKIIAKFLSKIDLKIKLTKNKLDEWMEIKKGLLQQLFSS